MKQILTLTIFLLALQVNAQVTEEWVARYNGPGNSVDYASSLAVDGSGNVYVTGTSLGSGTGVDYATIKYNSAGVQQWVARYNGPGNESIASSIAVDGLGNVYVTGGSAAEVSMFGYDYATIKYNSEGVEQWVQRYNGPSNGWDEAKSIAIDNEGNVYVTGVSTGIGTSTDYATIKYNSAGVEQWVQRYNGPGNLNDRAYAIAVDNEGNVYVTGGSYGFDSWDYATIKYNSAGIEQWVRRYDGPANSFDIPSDIAVDSEGSVFITGYSRGIGTENDYATIKYNSAGVEQWVQRYNGPSNGWDEAKSIAIDNEGNVYVTGVSTGIGTSTDYATIKYNSAGVEQWVQRYNGPANGSDLAAGIAVDSEGNVYVTGYSVGSGSGRDYLTIKYNTNGEEQWVRRYNGPGNSTDEASAIAIDGSGNVYVTGYSEGSGTGRDYATIKYSQTTPLVFTKPALNEKWMAGETDTIKWTGGQEGQFVIIEFSSDDGENYDIVNVSVPADSGYYIWSVPETILTTKAKIKLTDLFNPTLESESVTFRIKPYVLTRIDENGNYYEYRKNRDQFSVLNDSTQMWPFTWYNQFNYQGSDPFTYLNLNYSQTQVDSVFAKSQNSNYPDWISWVNAFSPDTLYRNRLLGYYKIKGTLRWKTKKTTFFGSCHGIGLANALVFAHRDTFVTKFPNFTQFNDPIEVISDNNFKKVIIELFTHQYGNPTRQNRNNKWNTSPNFFLNEVKEMLKVDSCKPRTVYFANNNGGGAHIVNVYGLRKDNINPAIYYVDIYDNSNPNSNNPITINTVANAGNGSWQSPDWPGWGGNQFILLDIPADSSLLLPTLPDSEQSFFELDNSKIEINNNYTYDISISDKFGDKTGFTNGTLSYEISDSYPLTAATGSVTPPYGYLLPDAEYSILIDNFSDELVETYFFTGNKSFVYERSEAAQTQTDRLFFDGGLSVTNPDAQTKTIKLMNLLDESSQEKFTVVRGIELVQNDSVKIENPDSNKIKLISYGSAKNYDIELNYVTENGIGRFGDFSIPLTANTSHTFVPEWTNLTNSQLLVLVDIGNNGTIDDTLTLVNQVTGIQNDQGSLLSPDSYNLAQNYPNPFNPSTKISWQSPVGSHQTLKIYDMLGNEVATLVDEYREAGRYEVTFDGSNLASGMYLYRLQAGSFVQTRKMILIK